MAKRVRENGQEKDDSLDARSKESEARLRELNNTYASRLRQMQNDMVNTALKAWDVQHSWLLTGDVARAFAQNAIKPWEKLLASLIVMEPFNDLESRTFLQLFLWHLARQARTAAPAALPALFMNGREKLLDGLLKTPKDMHRWALTSDTPKSLENYLTAIDSIRVRLTVDNAVELLWRPFFEVIELDNASSQQYLLLLRRIESLLNSIWKHCCQPYFTAAEITAVHARIKEKCKEFLLKQNDDRNTGDVEVWLFSLSLKLERNAS